MKSKAPILVVFLLAVVAVVAATLWATTRSGGGGGEPAKPDPKPAASQVAITMVFGSEKKEWIEAAYTDFQAAHPDIAVELKPMGSLAAAEAIVDGTEKPTVFSPADTLVLNLLASDFETKNHRSPYAKDLAPEPLVITPLVFAAWEDRGALLEKASGGKIGWKGLQKATADNRGWAAIGGPSDWGFVKLGHTDPTQSNSGLQALVLMAMDYHGRTSLTVADALDAGFQKWLVDVEKGVPKFEASTGTFMTDMVRFGPSRYDVAVVYESTAIGQIETPRAAGATCASTIRRRRCGATTRSRSWSTA